VSGEAGEVEEIKTGHIKTKDWSKLGSYPRAGRDKFASCVRIVDSFNMETLSVLEFEENETCFSIFAS
jgi:hypothetical protein